ncbi:MULTISPECIES: hypothetical protein [Hymenobacter]|uniref:hypothetical protein n=1 Tax=Hymenobacter TaxID=89966 RepID=UPI001564ED9B|nr:MULTISPECIES: hypothetical protein [Hymenobacter]QKG52935.1 hypothetical protein GKZ67_10350 [Hymenobacter sp. BRD67]
MPRFFTHLKLPLLALLTSFALTSCFDDHDKKCDPKPHGCCTGKTTPAPPTSGGAN